MFSLLGRATLVALRSDSKDGPFPEDWILSFTDEEISLFQELSTGVNDAEMRARLADIVWERLHDADMGRLAVESYLESARTLEDPRQWPHCADRIERAMNIARLLGKRSEHFARAVAHIEEVLDHTRRQRVQQWLLRATIDLPLVAHTPSVPDDQAASRRDRDGGEIWCS